MVDAPAGGGGGGGFAVVMSDLMSAASAFHAQAADLKGVIPADGPPSVDGGDGAFDANLQVVLKLIGTLSLQASGVIDADGGKLRTAHDRYASTEEGLSQLCAHINDPGKIR